MIPIHVAASLVAVGAGLFVVLLEKGTGTHRAAGAVYVVATYVLCGVSFFIFATSRGFSFFHAISVQNVLLVTIGLGAVLLRRRLRGWLVWHVRFMLYSYVVLIGTGTLQFLEHLPLHSPALNVVVFVALPVVTGFFLIERAVPRWRRQFGTRDRPEAQGRPT